MERDEAQARMREIQRIMERATLWTLLPGKAAVAGGILVLAGCTASYAMFGSSDFGDMLKMSLSGQTLFCLMWFAIGLAGVVTEVVSVSQAAKRMEIPPTVRSGRIAAFSMTPSVVVAMVLTLKFLLRLPEPLVEEVQYIVPIWAMLYGTGVYTAGLFSTRPPRVLGLAFLAVGIVALWLPAYGVVMAAVSFGLLHIVFGCTIIRKQREGSTE